MLPNYDKEALNPKPEHAFRPQQLSKIANLYCLVPVYSGILSQVIVRLALPHSKLSPLTCVFIYIYMNKYSMHM